MSRRASIGSLVVLALVGVIATSLLPRIPLSPAVHRYADDRSWFGIPYTLDVLSNIPFVIAGAVGLMRLRNRRAYPQDRPLSMWAILFAGIALTGFGSAYYHWHPTNETLVWDRLPMTVVFMSFLASLIAERIDARAGQWLLGPFLVAGITSVLLWHASEVRGVGDQRWYGLVQFLPMAMIPVMSLLFPPRYTQNGDLWLILGWYALALVFQFTDAPVYNAVRFVSGHALKHLCAGVAAWQIVQMFTGKIVARKGTTLPGPCKATAS